MRIRRTSSMRGAPDQIAANGVSRTLPQTIGIATHGITSP